MKSIHYQAALILCVSVLYAPIVALAESDEEAVARLDDEWQAMVGRNDAPAIAAFLVDDFALVTARGRVDNKATLVKEAATRDSVYEKQEDSRRTVRVYGDAAVVTALLWVKGTSHRKDFEYKLWFSDFYAKRDGAWRYVFAMAASALPKEQWPPD